MNNSGIVDRGLKRCLAQMMVKSAGEFFVIWINEGQRSAVIRCKVARVLVRVATRAHGGSRVAIGERGLAG